MVVRFILLLTDRPPPLVRVNPFTRFASPRDPTGNLPKPRTPNQPPRKCTQEVLPSYNFWPAAPRAPPSPAAAARSSSRGSARRSVL